jgi:hypothetical protein
MRKAEYYNGGHGVIGTDRDIPVIATFLSMALHVIGAG